MIILVMAGLVMLFCYRHADAVYREEKAKLYLPKTERVRAMAETEKEWIRTRQGSDGRLYMNGGGTTNPYFACLAAQGLLSGHVSEADLEVAGHYIDWHCQKFVEWNGEVPDFSVEDNVESTEKPDSVDAYVAVFLSLLCRKAEITGSISEAESGALSQGMRKLDELTAGGLTSVREGDSRFYLMDNIEVLACYRDIQSLGEKLDGFDESAKEAGNRAEETETAIRDKIWNPEAFRYEVGMQDEGKAIEAAKLDRFYPDGVVQVYGTVYGKYLTGRHDAEKLYERFCDTFSWETMEVDGVSFYWSELAMAAVELGDLERAEIYLDTYEKCMEDGRNYPLHVGTAGWMAKTCARMEEIYGERMKSSLLQDIGNRIVKRGKQWSVMMAAG